jgi:hypothetical protein
MVGLSGLDRDHSGWRPHLIKKIPVPGDYGWDYLTADSESRRLYVSHDKEGSGELLRPGLRGMTPLRATMKLSLG